MNSRKFSNSFFLNKNVHAQRAPMKFLPRRPHYMASLSIDQSYLSYQVYPLSDVQDGGGVGKFSLAQLQLHFNMRLPTNFKHCPKGTSGLQGHKILLRGPSGVLNSIARGILQGPSVKSVLT